MPSIGKRYIEQVVHLPSIEAARDTSFWSIAFIGVDYYRVENSDHPKQDQKNQGNEEYSTIYSCYYKSSPIVFLCSAD